MTDRKCKQWVQRPTLGQPYPAPLTMGPPMPPGNAHSGGHRRLHPHLRFDSVTSLAPDYSTLQATQSHRGSVSSSLSNLSSVSSMSTPTSQPWYRNQERFRIKIQNMTGIELRSQGLPALELPTCLKSLATVQVICFIMNIEVVGGVYDPQSFAVA